METEYQRMKREAEEGKPVPAVRSGNTRVKRDPEVAKARKDESVRRYQEARRRAHIVLISRHTEEFEEILSAERAGVDAEKGPLPGDGA